MHDFQTILTLTRLYHCHTGESSSPADSLRDAGLGSWTRLTRHQTEIRLAAEDLLLNLKSMKTLVFGLKGSV